MKIRPQYVFAVGAVLGSLATAISGSLNSDVGSAKVLKGREVRFPSLERDGFIYEGSMNVMVLDRRLGRDAILVESSANTYIPLNQHLGQFGDELSRDREERRINEFLEQYRQKRDHARNWGPQ